MIEANAVLTHCTQPDQILETAVAQMGQWTGGRSCAGRALQLASGLQDVTGLEPFPMAAGVLFVDTRDLEEPDREALRLWALLVGAALERCLSHQHLTQSSTLAAIGQLAAGVAHELNTPLGAINIALEVAIRNLESHPEKAESRLKLAAQASAQMQGIIDKLLHYARTSESQRSLAALSEVIGDTLQLVEHSYQLEGVQLDVGLEEGSAMINRGEIQQILINLLGNARQAASGCSPAVVRLRLLKVEPVLMVSISDSGPGVPEEIVQRIFEPFFTSKEVGQGLGLGLSISREIAEQHGGSLEYRGHSEFVLSLPDWQYNRRAEGK